MGLYITAYKNLKELDKKEIKIKKKQWSPGSSMDYSEKKYKGRAKGLNSKKIYSYDAVFEFSVGSYSGYKYWKEDLNNFAKDNQFLEIVDFSSTEGVIGPVVSKKLYEDFKENEIMAKKYSEDLDDKKWFKTYKNLMKAFEYGKENGAVEFG